MATPAIPDDQIIEEYKKTLSSDDKKSFEAANQKRGRIRAKLRLAVNRLNETCLDPSKKPGSIEILLNRVETAYAFSEASAKICTS